MRLLPKRIHTESYELCSCDTSEQREEGSTNFVCATPPIISFNRSIITNHSIIPLSNISFANLRISLSF
jgi:hypothetical protein